MIEKDAYKAEKEARERRLMAYSDRIHIYTKGQVQETANKENIKSLLNKEKLLKSTIIHDMI